MDETGPEMVRPTSTPTTPTVVLAQLQDPGTFCGTDHLDGEDWIAMYERVSAHNKWDRTIMLANLVFDLQGPAKAWYDNHKEELNDWDTCKQKLRDLFGRPSGWKGTAKKELATHVQTSTESCVFYIQDVLVLFHKADSHMAESDKVRHVLKGFADDAFKLLV